MGEEAVTDRHVSVEFVFDRSGERALANAYRILVPERRARKAQRRYDDDHDQASAEDGDRPALGA